MTHSVFISYAVEDRATALAICHALEQRTVKAWLAERDLQAGQRWGEGIAEAVRAARVLVVVLSTDANRSPWVPKEVLLALDAGVEVIPFRIEDVQPAGDLQLHLQSIHWLDALTPPMAAHIGRLADRVQGLLGPIPEDDRIPRMSGDSTREAGSRASWTSRPLIFGAVALVGTIALLIGQNLPEASPPDSAPSEQAEVLGDMEGYVQSEEFQRTQDSIVMAAQEAGGLVAPTGEATVSNREEVRRRERDSVALAFRDGRPADLPTLNRDLSSLVLAAMDSYPLCYDMDRTQGQSCLLNLGRNMPSGRFLYAMVGLSSPVLPSRTPSPVPDPVARCDLEGSSGQIGTFDVNPSPWTNEEQAGVHGNLAWGFMPEKLPAGEYWLSCEIGEREFESNRLNLEAPILPIGEFDLGPEWTGEVLGVSMSLGEEVASNLSVLSSVPVRASFSVPARVDAPLGIEFEFSWPPETVSGYRLSPSCRLANSGAPLSDTLTEIEGGWRHVAELTRHPSQNRQPWRPGVYPGGCYIGGRFIFPFEVEIRG